MWSQFKKRKKRAGRYPVIGLGPPSPKQVAGPQHTTRRNNAVEEIDLIISTRTRPNREFRNEGRKKKRRKKKNKKGEGGPT